LACSKLCPIMNRTNLGALNCAGSRCMAWVPVHIGYLRKNYGTRFTEEDNAGTCMLIYKEEQS
jgi:hypothetical protein